MKSLAILLSAAFLFLGGCSGTDEHPAPPSEGHHSHAAGPDETGEAGILPEEARHLKNLQRLTRGGEDAEAYFSPDGVSLVFQSSRQGHEFDQIYTVDSDGRNLRRLSPGPGKTTCAFFTRDGGRIVYATTHLEPDATLETYDPRKGEMWRLDSVYDVVSCNRDGSGLVRLTDTPGYDAECAVSRTTGRIVFCSMRTGDPELFVMNADGSDQKQLTSAKGYDGGPFFSVDGSKIIWRTYQPSTPEQVAEYDDFIARGAVGRWPMDIWIMNADGTEKRRITTRGQEERRTCWAPYLHPDMKTILFVSSSTPPGGGRPNFDLYTIGVDGQNLERITHSPAFDGFPMFSDDGKRIAFASSRGAAARGEVSVYLADWVP